MISHAVFMFEITRPGTLHFLKRAQDTQTVDEFMLSEKRSKREVWHLYDHLPFELCVAEGFLKEVAFIGTVVCD